MTKLHIPELINFECTGCGNCCLAWPVPLTFADQERIAGVRRIVRPTGGTGELFRPLKRSDPKIAQFTHTLEKRPDGRCEFLTEENRCLLHLEHGPEMKPSMCQLFPYTFNETPTGYYASVSFASTGTLLNAGRPLSEQGEFLAGRLELFKQLFPSMHPDWSNTQLVDGQPIDWDSYLKLEGEILPAIKAATPARIDKRLLAASRIVAGRVAPATDLERVPSVEARPKTVDQIVLRHLFDFYLPDDVFAATEIDLDAQAILKELVQPPPAVALTANGVKHSFQELKDHVLGTLAPETEDLLFRFVYARIFAKLYFGAGYAHLSVLAGLHHLGLLIALVRLKIKCAAIAQGRRQLDFLAVAEIVRALERRLTQASLSARTSAVLEVLLTSPERLSRACFLAG